MSRNIRFGIITVLISLAIPGLGTVCRADSTSDGRAILETNKNAVVTVQVVIETTTSYQGESNKRQTKASATGTIIDPSGLVVTSLTSVNPADRFKDMMGDDGDKLDMSSKVVDAKMRLDDGAEVTMDIVLRDADLDMAFLKPKKASDKPFAYVNIKDASSPKVLDEVVFLVRLGQVANRTLAAGMDRISAVLTKPRLCYVAGISAYTFGLPAFTLDGKPIGIVVLRTAIGKDRDVDDYSYLERMVPIVLPCSTVLQAAEQAKTAKPEATEAISEPKLAPKAEPKAATKPAAKAGTKPAPKAPKK